MGLRQQQRSHIMSGCHKTSWLTGFWVLMSPGWIIVPWGDVVTDTGAACTLFTHSHCHELTASAGCVHWHSNSELRVHSLLIKRWSKLWSRAKKKFSRTRWESTYFPFFSFLDDCTRCNKSMRCYKALNALKPLFTKTSPQITKKGEKTRRTKSYWIKLSLHFKSERSGLKLTAQQTNTGLSRAKAFDRNTGKGPQRFTLTWSKGMACTPSTYNVLVRPDTGFDLREPHGAMRPGCSTSDFLWEKWSPAYSDKNIK